MKKTAALLLVLAALTYATASAAAHPDCPRGTLDNAYCDRDNDLLADIPLDQEQWINPKTLTFAYLPIKKHSTYRRAWQGFLDHLSAKTGKRVRYLPNTNYTMQLRAMHSGQIHIAAIDSEHTPLAVNCTGYQPFTVMTDAHGDFGHEIEIITAASDGIDNPRAIKGQYITFSNKDSKSGHQEPAAILQHKFGLVENRDYKPVYSGSHEKSILGVINGQYIAAAVANTDLERMEKAGTVRPDQYRVLFKSQTFPATSYGVMHNLDPELKKAIREAFFSYDWKGSGLEQEFEKMGLTKFAPITYKTEWEIIRDIHTTTGVDYDCRF